MRFLYMRTFILLLLLTCHGAFATTANARWLFYGGAGNTYATSDGNRYTATYSRETVNDFRLLPVAGISWIPVIKGRLSLEAGLSYTRKTFRTQEHVTFIDNSHTTQVLFDIRCRLGYLGLPLLLSYTVLSKGNNKVDIAAGMQYSFLLKSKQDIYSLQSTDGNDPDEYYFKDNPLRKGLLQTKNTSPGTMNIFDTAIKLQLGYTWHNRVALRIFHEQSFYSVYLKAPADNASRKLRHTGLGLGIIL